MVDGCRVDVEEDLIGTGDGLRAVLDVLEDLGPTVPREKDGLHGPPWDGGAYVPTPN
jgi:hypothetical protein